MGGEISTMSDRFLALPLTSRVVANLSIDSSRRFVLAYCFTMTSELIVHLVPAALSIHREDGTMPRFVSTSLFDVSQDQRANEGGEKFYLMCSTFSSVL
jgi:hypothetical protein